MIKQISIKTRFGWIAAFENNGKIIKISFKKLKKQSKSKILENFRKNLLRYFNQKTQKIQAPCALFGNKIQKKVWAELKKIKFGNTKSYGEIAKKYKLSPRYVGKICGQNKLMLIVPCHRVIRSNGDVGGFSSAGGTKLKKKLLDFERIANK